MRVRRVVAALIGTAVALAGQVRFIGKTTYLNNVRAVVTHTFDDSSPAVAPTLDLLDKYGVKATAFVSTERGPIRELWPRLNRAVADGHEVGSHSRRHQCQWPDTEDACHRFYDDAEVKGSRDDILANTSQAYVWSWAYPCGNCAQYEFVWRRLAGHGYLAARTYPGETEDRHNVPDLQAWADNPMAAAYTQVVQKQGGIAKSGRTSVPELNAKFDEVYGKGGIYHFVSHPAWLDLGPDAFYERHLAHIARRADIWYVPFGPLYAYRTLRDSVEVQPAGRNRFRVSSPLDAKVYDGAVTLEFQAGSRRAVAVKADGRDLPTRPPDALTDRWNTAYFRQVGPRVWVTVRPNVLLQFR